MLMMSLGLSLNNKLLYVHDLLCHFFKHYQKNSFFGALWREQVLDKNRSKVADNYRSTFHWVMQTEKWKVILKINCCEC